jgi:hypothetical protein
MILVVEIMEMMAVWIEAKAGCGQQQPETD